MKIKMIAPLVLTFATWLPFSVSASAGYKAVYQCSGAGVEVVVAKAVAKSISPEGRLGDFELQV